MTTSLRTKLLHGVPLLIAAVVLAANVYTTLNCRKPAGCVDPYWSSFWILSYSDGYERRALLGQAMRLLLGTEIGYRALNAVAGLLVVACLILFWLLVQRALRQTREGTLVLVALVSGPPTILLLEVLGDPLTFCLLLALAFLLASSYLRSWGVCLAAIAVTLVMLAAHEAAAFLFMPFVALAATAALGRRPRLPLIVLAALACAAAFALLFNAQPRDLPSMAVVLASGELYRGGGEILPSFGNLLRQEITSYLEIPRGPPRFVMRFMGALAWPLIILLAVSHIMGHARALKLFAALALAASPLFVIAHDWGRFGVYLLILSLCLALRDRHATLQSLPGTRLVDSLMRITRPLFVHPHVYASLPLVFIAGRDYRISGLTQYNLVVLVGVCVLHAWILRQGALRLDHAGANALPGGSHQARRIGTY